MIPNRRSIVRFVAALGIAATATIGSAVSADAATPSQFDVTACSVPTWLADSHPEYVSSDPSVTVANTKSSVTVDRGLKAGSMPCSARFSSAATDRRLEFAGAPEQTSGTTKYYGFSIFLDKSWPTNSSTVIFQLVDYDATAASWAPSFQMTVQGDQFHFWNYTTPSGTIDASSASVQYRLLWSYPVITGQWLRFEVGVNWSTDASKGQVALWGNDNQLVTPTTMRTLYRTAAGAPTVSYPKFGIYGAPMATGFKVANFGFAKESSTFAGALPPR
ncbi:polysaccharide lyase-like protein [Jatrophihabitans sp. GAS493]|uniref:heparin lyase I family protein n=1 Tax=Jatrophihabitans sp. GAS493 TaxID=1907575 RepID=UPI000BBFA988|nr:heparin lyase I family protein [Jatrophihabitans sp. GAS493]SOD74222.1 polysaccharide lyase-like protein [Jatrophihabitans sp. GAS493]